MHLHTEVPQIAFPGTFAGFIFHRSGSGDDGGIDNHVLAHHQSCLLPFKVNQGQNLFTDVMFLQKMTEIHDGDAVGDAAVDTGKLTKWQHLMGRASSGALSMRSNQSCRQ